MNKSKDNCTAMIVGKKATIDGSTIIARDEDGTPTGYVQEAIVTEALSEVPLKMYKNNLKII